MNPSSAAEKISDLFHVTLSELETNIVSQTIKFSNQPQRLVEVLILILIRNFNLQFLILNLDSMNHYTIFCNL